MSGTTTLTVRLSGALAEFVAANVGKNGSYENIVVIVRNEYTALNRNRRN